MSGKKKIENPELIKLRKKIGENIRKIRNSKKHTQDQFAEYIGGKANKSLISRYESGVTSPDAGVLGLLAQKLDISMDEFFYYDELRDDQKIPGIDQEQSSIAGQPEAQYEPRQKVALSINIETDDPLILAFARQSLLPQAAQ